MRSHLTDCGIPGIAEVPYGLHMCHFYPSPQVLMDALTAYFMAGLRKRERCLWVGWLPLSADDIRKEVTKVPEFVEALGSGQLSIFDALEWYGEPSTLNAEALVRRLIDEEERAVFDGFEGLRMTGNASFVPRDQWSRFMEYEELLHDSVSARRILVSCAYHRDDCGPVDIMEIAHCHHAVLDKGQQYWQVFMPESRTNGHLR